MKMEKKYIKGNKCKFTFINNNYFSELHNVVCYVNCNPDTVKWVFN